MRTYKEITMMFRRTLWIGMQNKNMYRSFLGDFSVISVFPLDIENSGTLKCSVLPKSLSGEKKKKSSTNFFAYWRTVKQRSK